MYALLFIIALVAGNSITRPLSVPVSAKLPGPRLPEIAVDVLEVYEPESDGVIIAVIE